LRARTRCLDESLNGISNRFKLDVNELALLHPQGRIQLTRLEMRVLRLLMLNSGRFVSTGDLVAEVWSSYSAANRNMLKQVIFRLRRKLAENADAFQSLKSNLGGYMWIDDAITERIHATS
jgi:two-component system, OmpR family, response regulator protein BraR/BceR